MGGGLRYTILAAAAVLVGVVLAAGGGASANVFAGPGGGDPRVSVPRSALSPVGVVGVVDAAKAVRRTGTGFMVGPCHMMTAHHAAGPQLAVGANLRFFVGASAEGYRLDLTASGDGVVGSNGDWALLRVAGCPGLEADIGWMAVDPRPWTELPGRFVAAASLPFEAPADRLTHEAACALRMGDAARRLIGSDCSATGGASGAPLYWTGPTGRPTVVAMVTAVAMPTPGVLPQWDAAHSTLAIPVADMLQRAPAALDDLIQDWRRGANPLTPDRVGVTAPAAPLRGAR